MKTLSGEIAVARTRNGRVLFYKHVDEECKFDDMTDLLSEHIDSPVVAVAINFEYSITRLLVATQTSIYLYPVIDESCSDQLSDPAVILIHTFESPIKYLKVNRNKVAIVQTEDLLIHAVDLTTKQMSYSKIMKLDISINSGIKKVIFESRTIMILSENGSAYISFLSNKGPDNIRKTNDDIENEPVLLPSHDRHIVDIIFLEYRGYFIQTSSGRLYYHPDRGIGSEVAHINILEDKIIERVWAASKSDIIVQYNGGRTAIVNIMLGKMTFKLGGEIIELDYFNEKKIERVNLVRDEIYVLTSDGQSHLIKTTKFRNLIERVDRIEELDSIPLDPLSGSA